VIGIPQALAYYYHHTMWTVFFSELGFRMKTSGKTDRSIIEKGTALVPNEACLPLKCFAGHVAHLCAQRCTERIDLIFVPRLVCTQIKPTVKLCCPKFIGLPDMMRAMMPDAGLLSLDIDLRLRSQKDSFLDLAARLDRSNSDARHAYEAALDNCRPLVLEDALPANTNSSDGIRIALLGHRYLLEDPYLCLDVKKRLTSNRCQVLEHTTLSPAGTCQIDDGVRPTSWLFEDDILGGAHRFLHQNTVDGIVYLLSFGCGAGSITSEIIEHELRHGSRVPILRIIIDEHTAEEGFQTRLESFIDMIRIRKTHRGTT
jgi:predicted nucleotide-binding protein (sugar kinase/HSP70/actin superfamily)